MGRDERDTQGGQGGIMRVTIIGFIANEPFGGMICEACSQRRLNQGDFTRRSACHVERDWNTSAVCDCHGLGALAALGLPDSSAPFLARGTLWVKGAIYA